MHPGQVVVLHEVLADELPVRVDLVFDPAHEALLAEPVAGKPRREDRRARPPATARRDRGRRRRGSPTSRPAPGGARGRPCRSLHARHVEDGSLVVRDPGLGREQRRPETRAVEVVCPSVVRALEEALDASALPLTELRAAVTADVVVGAQLARAVTADDQRTARDFDHEEAARPLELVGHADGDPRGRRRAPARARGTRATCTHRGSAWRRSRPEAGSRRRSPRG